MVTIMRDWESTKPNPDEAHLKALWEVEIKSLERDLAEEEELAKRKQDKIMSLVKASGLSQGDIANWLKEDAEVSKKSLSNTEKQLLKSSIDIKALHDQDLKLAQANAKRIKSPGNPYWNGYIWDASYGGRWRSWNGEAEEVPEVTFDVGANRFDPRAQAWGEGWFDSDYSSLHAYVAFTVTPPSWGRLQIYTYPWLHGYYSLYSNDEWYNSEYARARLRTWVDVHQNFWRERQYRSRLDIRGDELHPARSGRIDRSYGHAYSTDVGERDTVTIRVGVYLYCKARASGGRSKLNFQEGAANYVYVPYVYWYLQQ